MGVDQHLLFKWWNLVSFYHEIVLLENVDPDEREDGAKAILPCIMGSNSLPLQG